MRNNNTNIELLSYSDYCKEFVSDHIDGFIGQTFHASDFASELTMGINVDGSATYSTYHAMLYLQEWWSDCADYWNYEKDNFGENRWNPFENPEAYHVSMVIEGVQSLLSQCSVIEENWDDEIEITQEVVDSILSEIEDKVVEF